MSRYLHKSHNVSVLIYPLVSPANYQRVVFDREVDTVLREVCVRDREALRGPESLEIGTDGNHVHFRVQSVPSYSPTKLVRTRESITAREIFRRRPEVKRVLWGAEFWGKGYVIST